MKLSRARESSSFYESFSDLIFTTMAIFVFLMVIFLTQVRPVGVPQEKVDQLQKELAQEKNAASNAEELQRKLEQESQARSQAQDELAKTNQALKDAIATREIELVIVVDTSGSMGPAINGQKDNEPHVPGTGLKDAILDLADSLPELSSGFHIGVIGYRETLSTFPITKILPSHQDSGRSRAELNAFIQRKDMQPAGGAADITAAMAEGVRWLGSSGRNNARKVLVVIGDIGPYETGSLSHDFRQERDAAAIQREQNIMQGVIRFSKESASSLLMLFAQPTEAPLQPETKSLFRSLARAVPDKRGRYTEDTTAMLGHIALAILAGEKRK